MRRLSIIVPAHNEEGNLSRTVSQITIYARTAKTRGLLDDYQIIIVDDGSTDRTQEEGTLLSLQSDDRKFHRLMPCRGLGGAYKAGLEYADYEYVVMIPGDGDVSCHILDEIVYLLGTADILIPIPANPEVRSIFRRVLSRAYTTLVNLLFGLTIQYYNGCVVHKTSYIRSVGIKTDSFGYQMEGLVKLLKAGRSYRYIPQYIRPRASGSSKALRWQNIKQVVGTLIRLCKEV